MEARQQDSWDQRLEEIIECHIHSLTDDFRRLIGELPVPSPTDPTPAAETGEQPAQTLARLKKSV